MAESAENVSEQRENKGGFLEGRKAPVIGCLLVLLFVIGILVAIFVVGSFEATPDDLNNPGP
jgi:hypothetical protein